MQIVIEIPEKMYHMINAGFYDYGDMNMIIQNGISLPKGHGRLKDFDKIEWYGCNLEGRGCIEANGDCSVCDHANCNAKQIRGLPTIIEADTEREE